MRVFVWGSNATTSPSMISLWHVLHETILPIEKQSLKPAIPGLWLINWKKKHHRESFQFNFRSFSIFSCSWNWPFCNLHFFYLFKIRASNKDWQSALEHMDQSKLKETCEIPRYEAIYFELVISVNLTDLNIKLH